MHDSIMMSVLAANADTSPSVRELYFDLTESSPGPDERLRARDFLRSQLAASANVECGLPDAPASLHTWMHESAERAGEAYSDYLCRRHAGAPREFFPARAHALAFLRAAAPTKLVDGAWLFGTLDRWEDAAFRPLITTYVEELGAGIPSKNHVAIYQRLLAGMGCEDWRSLPDSYFVQGAIQLALGWNAGEFLPELIGFNLGYEQLPLHLLITSYELNELGLDPYYFVLHITVDNASTGHALKAIHALESLSPRIGDSAEFYRRVKNGVRLSEMGVGTNDIIAAFDLDAELSRILVQKSVVGKNMHSDYCRVAGRTVNDWLSNPENVPAFLNSLVNAGWIVRGVPAEQSRFWRLIHGEHAEMFGVFSDYEQEVLRCWIEASKLQPSEIINVRRQPTHRALHRLADSGLPAAEHGAGTPLRPLLRRHHEDPGSGPGLGIELRVLEQRLAALGSQREAMRLLAGLMSPATHHTPVGLMATRIFQRMLG